MSVPEADLCRQAFGAAGALELEILHPGREAQRRAFEQPFVLVGRYSDNDICLKTDQVSRRHAYLQLIAGRVFFMDLGSREGISYQGQPCLQGWLEPGEGLQVGATILRLPPRRGYEYPVPPPAQDWNPTASLPPTRFPIPAVTLEINNGPGRKVRWRMNRFLALGGGAAVCKVRLTAAGVSQYHCSFVHTPVGLWVVDLLSREGIVLNDQPVRWARLTDGDRLQLGRFLVRPWYDDLLPGPAGALAAAPHAEPGGPWGDSAGMPGVGNGQIVPAPSREMAPQSASVLAQVMEQVNGMQQQMVDQFHQSMLMMIQMFSSMHRDQMGLIQQELGRLRQLTQELQDLQADLRKNGTKAPGAAPARGARSPHAEGPVETGVSPEQPNHPVPGNGTDAAGGRLFDPAARGTTGKPASQPRPPREEPAGDANIHDWLGQRIAALHAERQGRWEKLISMLKGS
jgi:pSer/pThr/pTyr-binding forkhead associated (FHA) protein